MGSPHKLKPEIEAFILEQKKEDPSLSCRKLSELIVDKFQVEISKSLVNAVIKQEGLSAPVGRRRKPGSPEVSAEAPEEAPIPEILVEKAPEPAPVEIPIPEEPQAAPDVIFPEPTPVKDESIIEELPPAAVGSQPEKISVEEKLFGVTEVPPETPPAEELPAQPPVEEPVPETPPSEQEEAKETEPLLLEQKDHIDTPLIEGKEPLEITSQVSEEQPAEQPVEEKIEAPEEAPVPEILVEKAPEPVIEEKPVIEEPVPETVEGPAQQQLPETPIEDKPVVTTPALEITFDSEPAKPQEAPVEAAPTPIEEPAAAPAQAQEPAPPPHKETPQESLTSPHIEDSPEIPELGEGVGMGAVLLKAVDSIVGGTYYLTRLVKEVLRTDDPEIVSRNESLIYAPLFKAPIAADSALWTLVNGKHDFQLVMSYLDDLHNNKSLDIETSKTFPKLFQEVLYLDIFMEGGAVYHMDSELRSVWSVPNIPFDYALPINKAKSLINRYFIRNKPLVLFSAPGYDVPTKEFCDFVLQWNDTEKKIEKITLVSNKADNIESIIVPPAGHRYVVFGLWPWQFTKYRRVINVGEFKPYYFEPLDQHFYITESEVTLVQPYTNQTLVFRACLLKRDPASKTTLLIGTNIDDDKVGAGEIAEMYLRHWPNLDEGFEDFSHKIELFTYTATSRRMFSIEAAIQETGKELDIRDILNYYLRCLDSYLRWHILPAGYEDFDFPTANSRFYSLKAVFYKKKNYYLVQFYVPKGYNYEADLAYMCRRLNEKDVTLRGGKLWFTYIKEQV